MSSMSDDEIRANKRKIDILRKEITETYQANAPKYERGLLEASDERVSEVIKNVVSTLKADGILNPGINRKIDTETKFAGDIPLLIYGGQVVTIQFRVFPKDGNGMDRLPEAVFDKIKDLEAREAELIRKLGEDV